MASGTLKASCFWSKRVKRILLVGCALVALVGCSAKPQTLKGTMVIPAALDSPLSHRDLKTEMGKDCQGDLVRRGGAFDDVKAGAQVLVKDNAGKLIATGAIDKGTVENVTDYGACVFSLSVPNVPASEFYTIEIGDRKGIVFSAEELKKKNLQVELQLGA